MFVGGRHTLENSFHSHDDTPKSYSEYGEYLAEYMNRRLGLYSIPKFSNVSFRDLIYKLEELGIARAKMWDLDPFVDLLNYTSSPIIGKPE